MNEPNWTVLQSHYGDHVVRYFKARNVLPERTDSGFYKISNFNYLRECSRIATIAKAASIRPQTIKQRNTNSCPNRREIQEFYDLQAIPSCIVKQGVIVSKEQKNVIDNSKKYPSICRNLRISFKPCSKLSNTIGRFHFSRSTPLKTNKAFNSEKLFDDIMRTNVGCQVQIDFKDCLVAIQPILRSLWRNHKKTKYSHLLENILLERDSSDVNAPVVSLYEFKKYFYQMFASVIPISLFGCHKNIKRLRQSLNQYYVARVNDEISLKKDLLHMDISKITWLRPLKDEETRWVVLAKMVKWLVEKFVVPLIKTVFEVQRDLYSQKKILLSAARWNKCKVGYMRMQRKNGSIERKGVSDPNDPQINGVPRATLILFPKEHGVRPIFKIRYTRPFVDKVQMLQALLQQAYMQKYDVMSTENFSPIWISYAERKKQNQNMKVHLVSSDISDAYGSIVHAKLYDIIYDMLNEIPGETLTLQWLAVLSPKRSWAINVIDYKQWFSDFTTFPAMKAHSMITVATDPEHEKRLISKQSVYSILRAHIFEQTFVYRETEYTMKRGVAQGIQLSGIFAEIYYAQMAKEEFGCFIESGNLVRFVDDFLYITDNEESAKEYLEKIKTGVSAYNCNFNIAKTQTNVESEYFKLSTSIEYLGYRIDPTSLGIVPFYRDTSYQYSTSLRNIQFKDDISIFAERLRNLSVLKLSRVVLDTKINSSETILVTATSAASVMASRTIVLISAIFSKFEFFIPPIWNEICISVDTLTSVFVRYLDSEGERESRNDFIRQIKLAIWKSHLQVFTRQECFRAHFCQDIKRMINRHRDSV